jgi:hypothetical protein
MAIEKHASLLWQVLAQAFYDRRPPANVWNEMAVHHIDVQIIFAHRNEENIMTYASLHN